MPPAVAGSETFPALIARIATGDRDAFSRFYDLAAPLAFGLIRRVLRDPEAAAEVLQEVFWQVWKEAPWAIGFYARFGFTVVGSAKFYFGEQIGDDHIMARAVVTGHQRKQSLEGET